MVDAGKQALSLWALQLVPSLFPFMILSTLFLKAVSAFFLISPRKNLLFLRKLTGLSVYGFIIFLFGQTCGYPIGAKLIADAYQDRKIERSEADYLMTISNQSSPIFLYYYVSSYALSDKISGLKLIVLFLFGTFFTSLCTRFLYPTVPNILPSKHRTTYMKQAKEKQSIFVLLDQSISESSLTMLKIGGYIILFSILSDMLLHHTFLSRTFSMLLVSALEISNGLFLLKNHFALHPSYLILVIALTSFGGLCTLAQIKGMLVGTSLSIKPYIIGKIIHVIFTVSLTILLVQIKIL